VKEFWKSVNIWGRYGNDKVADCRSWGAGLFMANYAEGKTHTKIKIMYCWTRVLCTTSET